jgi:hypothetical protein
LQTLHTELADLRPIDHAANNEVSAPESAFGLPDNEMTQSIIAAINPRWNMTSYA